MKARITQKDVANALGIHVSTVSKALKGDPAIAIDTQDLVKRKAQTMGFSPDPMLSALASYRNRQKHKIYHSTIAWIYNHPQEERMEAFAGYEDYFEGASNRAQELGYKLEPFWVGDEENGVRTLERILRARGIRGIIIGPQDKIDKDMPLNWSEYGSVAIGYSLKESKIDRVTNDHFATMTGLLEHLHGYGYKRIGCYLWETDNERMAKRARSAFAAVTRELGSRVQLYTSFRPETFMKWIHHYKFDAVVCRGVEQLNALLHAGYRVPEQMGLAGYALNEKEKQISGMQHNNSRIGAAAVELVSGKIQRSQFGLSAFPQRLLIMSEWLCNGTLKEL